MPIFSCMHTFACSFMLFYIPYIDGGCIAVTYNHRNSTSMPITEGMMSFTLTPNCDSDTSIKTLHRITTNGHKIYMKLITLIYFAYMIAMQRVHNAIGIVNFSLCLFLWTIAMVLIFSGLQEVRPEYPPALRADTMFGLHHQDLFYKAQY